MIRSGHGESARSGAACLTTLIARRDRTAAPVIPNPIVIPNGSWHFGQALRRNARFCYDRDPERRNCHCLTRITRITRITRTRTGGITSEHLGLDHLSS